MAEKPSYQDIYSLRISSLVNFLKCSALRSLEPALEMKQVSISEKNMVQTLETIRGGGGSIKVGTTGTISALMSRELETTKTASSIPDLCKKKSPTICASLPSGATTPRKLKPRTSLDEASSSSTSRIDHRSSESFRKSKHYNRRTHQIPILDADNVSVDGTPIKTKSDRKGSCIVEIVDIKCGNPDRAWASPVANRLKKLGFSKLSESII